MNQDIERAVQRARQYWYDDGLTEMATGCCFVAIGLLFLAEAFRVIPPGVSSLGLIAVVAGGMWLSRRAIGIAKTKLTYPRTGYVRYPRRNGRRRKALAGGVAGVMGALVASLFATGPVSLTWIPALDGLIIGAFLLYLAYNLSLSRFYALAVASAIIGTGASLSGTGDILGSGIYFGLMGGVTLGSGAVVLATYLRRTQGSRAE